MTGSPLEKDEEEQAKRGIGTAVLYLLKHPATWPLLFGGAAAWGWLRPTNPAPEDVYWDKSELRQIVRQEVRPLEAGILTLAERQSDKTQIAVFKAIDLERRKIKDNE